MTPWMIVLAHAPATRPKLSATNIPDQTMFSSSVFTYIVRYPLFLKFAGSGVQVGNVPRVPLTHVSMDSTAPPLGQDSQPVIDSMSVQLLRS